jgi:hypothetical protein
MADQDTDGGGPDAGSPGGLSPVQAEEGEDEAGDEAGQSG